MIAQVDVSRKKLVVVLNIVNETYSLNLKKFAMAVKI